ncbi:MAG TPA: choice-of-anchor L domain-containing protein, partial [Polyangiaceae bacterium]
EGGFTDGADGGASSNSSSSSGGSSSGSGGTSGDGAVGNFGDGQAGSSGGTVQCNVTNPDADMDKDGWTPNQGDCNDCDPNVNPGAIDVLHSVDGGTPVWGNEDCSGMPGDNAMPCDQGLALGDLVAGDGAKAIELCATASMTDRKYGVLSAAYVRADGTAFPTVAAQVGIESAWGTSVKVQGGQNMLAMSSGYSRTVGQTGACNGISCQTNATGTPPPGFPQDDPACPPTPAIADDVALELQIRVPTNATGYSFNFKFYSFEFPDWVCDTSGYNDQFVALVSPPPTGSYVPTGSTFGNISFDSNNHPVSVNMGFFDACDPTTPARFASHCKSGGGACPPIPSPYCPLGVNDLAGTGFDVWHSTVGPAGATRWLKTQAPAQPGSVITVRFAIWDAGNSQFDSTVLVDNFQWIATGGTVAVGTTPAQ